MKYMKSIFFATLSLVTFASFSAENTEFPYLSGGKTGCARCVEANAYGEMKEFAPNVLQSWPCVYYGDNDNYECSYSEWIARIKCLWYKSDRLKAAEGLACKIAEKWNGKGLSENALKHCFSAGVIRGEYKMDFYSELKRLIVEDLGIPYMEAFYPTYFQ